MTDSIKVEIDLSCDFWNYNPFNVSVMIDDKEIYNGEIEEKTTVSDTVDLDEGEHQIKLILSGKTIEDTITDGAGGPILKDVLLNVHDIRFDDISVGQCIWSHSVYKPEEKANAPSELVKNCVNLGWNGVWEFPFEMPIYIWLLENLD